MIDWWQNKHQKLPTSISSFSNWLDKTRPDPKLTSERLSKLNKEEEKKKQELLDKTPTVSKETLDKLREAKKNLFKPI